MHYVLQNPYLLHEILQCLEPGGQDCYNAALTCRLFRKPAQDILWRCINTGILPLFDLLPMKKEEDIDNGKIIWYLDEPITPSDLERLKLFGSRIHHLCTTYRCTNTFIDAGTYATVLQALQGQPLFPNLRFLKWTLVPGDSTVVFQLFHSPRLKSVEIGGSAISRRSDTHDISRRLGWVPDTSVFVQKLDPQQLVRLVIKVTCPERLLQFITTTFTQLKELSIEIDEHLSLDVQYLQALSNFPQLHTLHLQARCINFEHRPTLAFPHLKHLFITCAFDEMVTLLSLSTFPALHSLTHRFILPRQPNAVPFPWSTFFKSLNDTTTSHFSELHLGPWKDPSGRETFTTEYYPYIAQNPYDSFQLAYAGVPFESIADPLLKLNVSALALDFPLFTTLTLEHLKVITSTWPDLTTLHLHCSNTVGTRLDNMALLHIASHLPCLTDLALDLNTEPHREEPHTIIMNQLPYFHPLEKLALYLFKWQDTGTSDSDLALYIDVIFPRLRKFEELSRDGEVKLVEREQRINEFVRKFQLSRSIERYRQDVDEITEHNEEEEEDDDDDDDIDDSNGEVDKKPEDEVLV